MSDLTVITNNVPRLIIDAYELTADERTEKDYLNWAAIDKGEDSASFVRYLGWLYDLGEFSTTYEMPAFSPLAAWDGYLSDSYFSGILVRYAEDTDYVVMGRFYS